MLIMTTNGSGSGSSNTGDHYHSMDVPFLHNFDHIIQFDNDQIDKIIQKLKSDQKYQSKLSSKGFFPKLAITTVYNLIEKCLGKRVTFLDWNIEEDADDKKKYKVRFGLIIDRELAYKISEKCDYEDNEEKIEDFKKFWGEKSELRRFRDGSICETVVFDKDKSRVCYHMVKYIFKKHLDLTIQDNDYLDDQLCRRIDKNYLLVRQQEIKKEKIPKWLKKKNRKRKLSEDESIPTTKATSINEISNLASTSFDDLAKKLRQLEGLPLDITSVQATTSIVRYTNVLPTPPQRYFSSSLITEQSQSSESCLQIKEEPLSKMCKVVEPIGVLVQLETSGKWPNNLEAIEKLKCAFLIRIGELLKSQFDLTIQVYPNYLNVLKDGFIFQIEITYFRELTLLKQITCNDGILKVRDNPVSIQKERTTLILPQLTSTLHSFNLQYEPFGKTCRIAKRWISSKFLLASAKNDNPLSIDVRFTEESIELLVAYTFIAFKPHLSSPNESQTAFLRFLHLLSNFNWKEHPLIINFHDKLTIEEKSNIETEFTKERKNLPPIFISTPEDKLGSVWTANLSSTALKRVVDLANDTLEFLISNLATTYDMESIVENIFKPKLDHFDLLIFIKKNMNPKLQMSLDEADKKVSFVEYTKTTEERMPIVDFDPGQKYLEELRERYGLLVLFLNDQFDGNFIGVMWKPELLKKLQVKGNGSDDGNEDKNIPDIGELIESFRVIGDGLVDNIKVQSENWNFKI